MQERISSYKWRGRLIRFAPLFVWIGVIAILSSSQGSFSETSRFIGPVLRILFPDAPPETLAEYHGYIRKFAHLAVYFVLGVLALRTCILQVSLSFRSVLFSLAIVTAVASLDELNQSYNAARTGTPSDIFLDCVGGIIGIGLFGWWSFKNQLRRRPRESTRV